MKEKFYITTAIPYCSGKPHIGNTYEVILTDAIARYKRQRGYDVFFLTGTDEHGLKIENAAKERGITPQQYVDEVCGKVKDIWSLVGASYDKFIRTTDDYHEAAVTKIFKKLLDQGDIYKGEYEGWYCVPCESFFTDTQVTDCKCPDCGRAVERAKEESYFFRMSKYADRLLKHIEDNPDFIEPEARAKEMINNFIKPGLQDLCVTRSSFTWGVPVPGDEKHVIYVWIDALSNYITALGYDPAKEVQPELFQKYWPADVHMIGKDIVRFHSIYWTIILMALGLPLPEKVFGHPWFNFGVDKMSKSRGNVIYADRLAELFTVDGVRHYALAEMPYNSDGSITYEAVISRFNNDLVNNLGNLVKRTLDMMKKYFGGVIQAPTAPDALDDELKEAVKTAYAAVVENMDSYHISDAVEAIFTMLRRANKYIDETTPWALAKDEAQTARLGTVLYNLLEVIRTAAVLLTPFIPATAEEILRELNAEAELSVLKATADEIGRANAGYLIYDEFIGEFGKLEAGKSVGDSKVLFARIDEKKMMEQLNAELEAARKAAEAKAKADAVPEKPEGCAIIGIEDFMKVELRTAKVLAAEPVPKAKKLLKLQLDLGYEQRQVVSGIAKFYKPEELIGRRVAMVANLAPAKLCGIESQGMILASGEETVRVIFLADDTPLGERIR